MLVGVLVALCGCTSAPKAIPRPVGSTVQISKAIYFVDCSGGPGGTGSRAEPWNELAQISEHGAFAAGDSILLRRGTVCDGQLRSEGSGTNGDPITLGAYGTGAKPVVEGGGTVTGTGAVELRNQHDWIVEDLSVTNYLASGIDSSSRAGILVLSDRAGRLANIVIRNNDVSAVTSNPASYPSGGIVALVAHQDARDIGFFNNLTIENNSVSNVGRTGIIVWSDPYPSRYITHAVVIRNAITAAQGDGIVLYGVDGGEVDWNVSRGSGHLPPCPFCAPGTLNTATAGIWPTRSRNINLRYNEVSGQGASGGDGEGLDVDIDTTNIVIEGNYSHDNGGGGVLICGAMNADIRYNILQHNNGGEINFSCRNQFSGIRIYNNDISTLPGSSVDVVRTVEGNGIAPILFMNNIVINNGVGGYEWPAPVTAANNTLLGEQSASDPRGPGILTVGRTFAADGTGGEGIDSMSGYRLVHGSTSAKTGSKIDHGAGYDYRGVELDLASTDRGALAAAGIASLPKTPQDVVVSSLKGGLRIRWAAATTGTTYEVLRSRSASGPYAVVATALAAWTFDDLELPVGTEFFYRVQSENRVGRSSTSTETSSLVE